MDSISSTQWTLWERKKRCIINVDTVMNNSDKKYDGDKESPEELFVKYRRWVNHPRWNDILTVVHDKLKNDWATNRNNQDCGMFVMRHTEMFMGTQDRHWVCGFPNDKKKLTRIIAVLRKKYATKMVTSIANIHREKVIREANDLDNKERKK
ncbi:hypothetical protein L1987_77348 [Smallanthus sonchifolius]|uniref:Uncharacterized protein n=1 Tax=Smallanthus sonchifolius TaxID=185202 RepID=A0ACB8ZAL4_9ASTR|nr:hypothetical protein L1987_77348 [Smallanthus sonchifolius]